VASMRPWALVKEEGTLVRWFNEGGCLGKVAGVVLIL